MRLRTRGGAACLSVAFALFIGVVVGGAIITSRRLRGADTKSTT